MVRLVFTRGVHAICEWPEIKALVRQLWTRRLPFNQRLEGYGLRNISEVGDSASDVLRDRHRAEIVDDRRRRFSRDRDRAVH